MLDRESFTRWREDPVTKEVMEVIKSIQDEATDRLLAINPVTTINYEHTVATLIGGINAYRTVLTLDYEGE